MVASGLPMAMCPVEDRQVLISFGLLRQQRHTFVSRTELTDAHVVPVVGVAGGGGNVGRVDQLACRSSTVQFKVDNLPRAKRPLVMLQKRLDRCHCSGLAFIVRLGGLRDTPGLDESLVRGWIVSPTVMLLLGLEQTNHALYPTQVKIPVSLFLCDEVEQGFDSFVVIVEIAII